MKNQMTEQIENLKNESSIFRSLYEISFELLQEQHKKIDKLEEEIRKLKGVS